MAFSLNNNNQYSPSVNGYAFFNKDSIVDKTMLSFNMWKTTIRISIYPLIESSMEADNEPIKYDKKNGQSIYLTPFKAKMFAKILKDFLVDPASAYGKGVPSAQSLISIEDPTDPKGMNKVGAMPAIVIRKINQETGMVESAYAYEINPNPYLMITDYDTKTGKFVKSTDPYKYLEIEMFIQQLETYAQAMSGAVAFTVIDNLYPSLDKLATKLGVDLGPSYSTAYRSNSYFANNSGEQSMSSPSTSGLSSYTGSGLEAMMNS